MRQCAAAEESSPARGAGGDGQLVRRDFAVQPAAPVDHDDPAAGRGGREGGARGGEPRGELLAPRPRDPPLLMLLLLVGPGGWSIKEWGRRTSLVARTSKQRTSTPNVRYPIECVCARIK